MRVVASSGPPRLSWLMLLVWSACLTILQALWAGRSEWVPDFGAVLLLACAARFDPRELPRVALCVALGRIPFAIEPPVAIVAGYLGSALVLRGLRVVLELSSAVLRSAVGLLLGMTLPLWWEWVHLARDGHLVAALSDRSLWFAFWQHGLATALAAALLAPALLYLPGLTPLRQAGSSPLRRRVRRRMGAGRAAW